MQDRTILIVTHSAEIAQLLANILEAGGYVPDVTSYRDALLRTASITHPALILLDCDHESLPDVDGLPSARRASVVLFSPSRLADEVRGAADRYKLPYLTLPIGPRALLQFVRQAIGAHDARESTLLAEPREVGGENVTAA